MSGIHSAGLPTPLGGLRWWNVHDVLWSGDSRASSRLRRCLLSSRAALETVWCTASSRLPSMWVRRALPARHLSVQNQFLGSCPDRGTLPALDQVGRVAPDGTGEVVGQRGVDEGGEPVDLHLQAAFPFTHRVAAVGWATPPAASSRVRWSGPCRTPRRAGHGPRVLLGGLKDPGADGNPLGRAWLVLPLELREAGLGGLEVGSGFGEQAVH